MIMSSLLLRRMIPSSSCALLLGACVGAAPSPSEDETGDTTASESGGSTAAGATDDGTTTGEGSGNDEEFDEGSDDASDDGAPLVDCNDPQEVPPAPVDCSAAEGVITNSVIIEPGGDDPSILEGVRRIEGSLRISRLSVSDLAFMACVQEVTGDVTIFGNDQLTNVDALWSLTSIGTDFIFSENDAITDFDGLPNVTTISRNLVIKNNAGMQTISGFQQLEEVGDNLLIQQNDVLRDMFGLGGLRTVGNVFAVTANPELCISSVNCVGVGITDPATPPPEWSTQANDFGC
jgi:hypothetical protein